MPYFRRKIKIILFPQKPTIYPVEHFVSGSIIFFFYLNITIVQTMVKYIYLNIVDPIIGTFYIIASIVTMS